ncbi:hypothetical protein [Photobacterium sp. OFAV2-7]|uniref:hypothetical protein n=1 Tax=Photobacterium sp. OFAV2-7 TaxID=2917748 RepID=UPI001EF4C039|nr:hypothetical protein [Photobacterium sp. OFAV2-7]MCG7584597.1 hypothetical protein [Photobacterium sp. OFAV2-7]
MKRLLVVASYAFTSFVLWNIDVKPEQNGFMFQIQLALNTAESRARPAYRPKTAPIAKPPDSWGNKTQNYTDFNTKLSDKLSKLKERRLRAGLGSVETTIGADLHKQENPLIVLFQFQPRPPKSFRERYFGERYVEQSSMKLYDLRTLCVPTGKIPYPHGFGVCTGPELESYNSLFNKNNVKSSD